MPKHAVAAFLPAAGLGERLRPVTNHLPKPLLPILGKPIIERILEELAAVCAGEIGINLFWKAELLRAWAAASPWRNRIVFFPEDPILGTGGALKNAQVFLSRGPFIVHNSDILLDIDFSRLIETHLSSGNTATLVCHRLPHLSNVVVDERGQVLDVENPGASRPDPSTIANKVAYTGIAVYSPEILTFLPAGVSHATVAWIAASKAGHKIRVMDVTGAYWNDVGDPTTYVRGVLDALRDDGETVYLSSAARCGRIEIDGHVVVESGSTVRDASRLTNCVVMPGADVSGSHENAIIGPDYVVALAESDMQPALAAVEKKRVALSDPLLRAHWGSGAAAWTDAVLIGLGGSERRYYRVRHDGGTAVMMECRPEDPDFERHLVYTDFFARHAVPVPALLAADHDGKRALFEDLGDTQLYAYLKLPHDGGGIEHVYRGVLRSLVTLHATATQDVDTCPPLKTRVFDYDYFRWETTYFLDRFVSGLCRREVENRPALDEELHRLATSVGGVPKTIIHRDFQCQNIMIHGGVPRFIDYQGARMAPPAYDVASVLWDPYYRLEDGVRERLLGYYVSEMTSRAATAFDAQSFVASLIPCRLQRHMQALGAYGFLSAVKGKKYFLKHVPEALRLLKAEAVEVRRQYPELARLVGTL